MHPPDPTLGDPGQAGLVGPGSPGLEASPPSAAAGGW